jgi:glyoxylase-like metal-dependent hydrolase (beta-lactamase superfamily II)
MKHITGNTYMSKGPITLGAYILGGEAMLVDSGYNQDYLLGELQDIIKTDIKYVFNTHSHSNHCGGNLYLQQMRRAAILAPRIEADIIEYPHLKNAYLYGFTPRKLLIKQSLYAEPCKVYKRISLDENKEGIPYQMVEVRFREHETYFSFIRLKGHSPNMMGIITPDNIAFLGDALYSHEELAERKMMYTYNLADHLYTLAMLEKLEADGFVISHGGYFDDIQDLIVANREHLIATLEEIYETTKDRGSLTLDQMHQLLYQSLDLEEDQIIQARNHSIIKAHLYYLQEQGRLVSFAEGGIEYVQTI